MMHAEDEKKMVDLEQRIDFLCDLILKANSCADTDPRAALFHVNKSAEAICRHIFTMELGSPSKKILLDELIKELAENNKIPSRIRAHLTTIQSYSNLQNKNEIIDAGYSAPCISALAQVVEWYFTCYLKRPLPDKVQPFNHLNITVFDTGEHAVNIAIPARTKKPVYDAFDTLVAQESASDRPVSTGTLGRSGQASLGNIDSEARTIPSKIKNAATPAEKSRLNAFVASPQVNDQQPRTQKTFMRGLAGLIVTLALGFIVYDALKPPVALHEESIPAPTAEVPALDTQQASIAHPPPPEIAIAPSSEAIFREAKAWLGGNDKTKWPEAVKHLTQLAKADKNTDAMHLLGFSYYNGRGVSVNYKLGCKWYKQAAALGDQKAKKFYEKSIKCH
jgi:hypothetical protein